MFILVEKFKFSQYYGTKSLKFLQKNVAFSENMNFIFNGVTQGRLTHVLSADVQELTQNSFQLPKTPFVLHKLI